MFDLNADERSPAVALGNAVHLSELPRLQVAGTDIADFACEHEIVQSPHGLLHWRRSVESVDLQQIDVVRLQASKAAVSLIEDRGAREAGGVDVVALVFEGGVEGGADGGVVVDEAEAFG